MLEDLFINHQRVTRRQLFGASAHGIGAVALASLLGSNETASGVAPKITPAGVPRGLPGLPHFAPKAKRVVCLWQGGGPSHVDLFDPKPEMVARKGQDIPESIRGTTRLSTMTSGAKKWPIQPAIK